MSCIGTILQPESTPWYTSDFYMILPVNQLLCTDVRNKVGTTFNIEPSTEGQRVEFALWVNDTQKWIYQSDAVNCFVDKIDDYNARIRFEDGGGLPTDTGVLITCTSGLVVEGQAVIIGGKRGKNAAFYYATATDRVRLRNFRYVSDTAMVRTRNMKHDISDICGGVAL